MKKYKIVAVENELNEQPITIIKADNAAAFFRLKWEFPLDIQEACYCVYLDRANVVKGYSLISLGGLTGTVMDTRIIFKYAVELLAVGFVIAHNHPSGMLKPSEADLKITKKIQQAGQILDIILLDHVILTENEFLSFANEGLL
jgi:DNA repair protein RadC